MGWKLLWSHNILILRGDFSWEDPWRSEHVTFDTLHEQIPSILSFHAPWKLMEINLNFTSKSHCAKWFDRWVSALFQNQKLPKCENRNCCEHNCRWSWRQPVKRKKKYKRTKSNAIIGIDLGGFSNKCFHYYRILLSKRTRWQRKKLVGVDHTVFNVVVVF